MAESQRLDGEINEIRHSEARAETGLRMLQEQERRADGVHRGVKDVLAEMHRFPGIVGMVADLCRIPDDYVVAIEVALGKARESLQELSWFEVEDIRGHIGPDGKVAEYQVVLKVAFHLKD